jgi:tetratricopeptide (TPR) repeat protein
MKPSALIQSALVLAAVCLIPAAGFGEDTNIIFKHDQTGVADEVNKIKEFDFQLEDRERDRMKEWNIEDSTEAVKVGDVYYEKGELEDAIFFYQIAIKIDPANAEAHEKYITARKDEESRVSPRYHRAMEYYRKGMKEKAVDELIAEIKEHPENETARIKLNEIESE